MAADTSTEDTGASDYATPRPRRPAPVDFDTRLAPTCMIWSMFIVLASFAVVILFWSIGNWGTVFR
ncbi:MAG TPA: hypothetical protein VEW94_00970 [Chloroflexia bacterium]|nr:hypothetical protein [Chloroflexia bacterium]